MVAETVILNLRTGRYHGLDEIGTRFFAVMRESADLSASASVLAADFEQPLSRIQEDLTAFVGELVDLGLVELQPQA